MQVGRRFWSGIIPEEGRLEDPRAAHGVPGHCPFSAGLRAPQFNSSGGQQTWFSLLVLAVMLWRTVWTSLPLGKVPLAAKIEGQKCSWCGAGGQSMS